MSAFTQEKHSHAGLIKGRKQRGCFFFRFPVRVKSVENVKSGEKEVLAMLLPHIIANKIDHHDRNGHITGLHLPLRSHNMIINKSCRLAKLAKMRGHFYLDTKNMVPSIEKTINTTAVIILVILLIILLIGSL